MPTWRLTTEILNAAIEGFEQQKSRIDAQIAELKAMLPGGGVVPDAQPKAGSGRRVVSAAGRGRIKEAQQRRRAKAREEADNLPMVAEGPKRRRKMSAAGKAAIADAQKKRWAAKKAEEEQPKVAATKKLARKKGASKRPVKAAQKSRDSKQPKVAFLSEANSQPAVKKLDHVL